MRTNQVVIELCTVMKCQLLYRGVLLLSGYELLFGGKSAVPVSTWIQIETYFQTGEDALLRNIDDAPIGALGNSVGTCVVDSRTDGGKEGGIGDLLIRCRCTGALSCHLDGNGITLRQTENLGERNGASARKPVGSGIGCFGVGSSVLSSGCS